ncbi:meiotic recombination [Raphidocelis subcapitata]|uniref:Meiotic recombination n=1 Tax=Raphidocelis subcapitata TaxID=307507 RepID=A0A2V0PFL7_9CHLO|nr:meiotic recombination [Raphidocelis subcapitata]|eukprot:GBF98329.1 meiotic recombination [Raphidocelis subcapitata]
MAVEAALNPGMEVAEGEVEVDDFNDLNRLGELGIGAGALAKLYAVKGLSEAKAEKMIEAARKITSVGSWQSGTDCMLRRQREIVRITCGSSAVDQLLGGGLAETKCITEMYGEFRTGKTQLCHTLCVTTQLPIADGGGAGKVAFVDTEGTFRPERVRAIAARFNLDPDAVLDNILYARAYTHEAQLDLLAAIAAKMVDEPFKLLVVDSIMANFRTDFVGRGELSERQQKLGVMMAALKKLSEEFNVAVIITNQVQSDPGGGMTFVQDPKKPIGGHVLAHASTQRLFLRKGKGEQRVVKVVDSPCLAEGEASFAVSDVGVVDYKE